MAGPEGEDNCSECGLFWIYHNKRRPKWVGVGKDSIGPKLPRPWKQWRGKGNDMKEEEEEMTSGPKIIESGRKRRLGSVHTGSGSDPEAEAEAEEGTGTGKGNDEEMTSGPKIIESGRKRRLGSINTGSGSDPEEVEQSDDDPISLVNLAILARKVQCTILSLGCSDCSALSRAVTSQLTATLSSSNNVPSVGHRPSRNRAVSTNK
jgi:hypothetical protein